MPSSRGQLQVVGADASAQLASLNDALRRVRDELDELHGLRGASRIFGAKTFEAVPVRWVDATGTLLHAWGTTT